MVLLLLVLVAASCADAGERVAVLGDSITSLDSQALEQDLGADYRLAISGNFGMTAEQAMGAAEDLATRSYGQVIINLGTNDVLEGRPVDEAVKVIERQSEMFDSARCVHLVTVNEHMVDQRTGRSTSDAAARFNDELRALVDSQDRLHLIDWNARAAEALDGGDPTTSTLTSDSIHPTPEGNQVLNGLYADALADCDPLF